jgi:ABC-2 type transport system permease protein
MKALKHLIKKEFIQLKRTKAIKGVVFGMPLVQLLIIGFAVSGDVEKVPTAIVDLDRSVMSRSLVNNLENTRYLKVNYRPASTKESEQLLQRNKAIIAVTIPKDFEKKLVRGEKPEISVLCDAQNTNTALTGAGYVRRIVFSWVTANISGAVSLPVNVNTVQLESRIWYNPEMKTVYFMVPGIIVLLVTIISIMLPALSIVRERGEHNTLEQLMVTPMTRTELIFGKTIPYAIVGIVELTIALIFGKLIYDIPIVGSLFEFYLMTLIFMFTTIGIGIFVSTVSQTQQQALFTGWFIMIFCILMSGFFLPIENMPKIMYDLTYIDPFRYYLTIVRELFIKGAGIKELWPETLALGVTAVIVLSLAIARFQKRLG